MSNELAPTAITKARVLFVCAGNTCRSVLAEHIARKKYGRIIEPSSAGLQPGTIEDAANAIYTINTLLDVDAKGHLPRDVRTMGVDHADLIVAMDNKIATEVRRLFSSLPAERLVIWKIKDPYGDDLEEYQRCAHSIHSEMKKLPILTSKS